MFPRCLLFFFPAACLLAQNPTPPPAKPNVAPDKVVLSVGDQKITAAQLDLIIDSLPEQYRVNARGPGRREFGQNLARILVLAQEASGASWMRPPTTRYRPISSWRISWPVGVCDVAAHTKVDDAELHKFYDAHKTGV